MSIAQFLRECVISALGVLYLYYLFATSCRFRKNHCAYYILMGYNKDHVSLCRPFLKSYQHNLRCSEVSVYYLIINLLIVYDIKVIFFSASYCGINPYNTYISTKAKIKTYK